MKIFLLTFLIGFSSLSFTAQNYKLIPDSCTYCFYQNMSNYFGWSTEYYKVDLDRDTVINGNIYEATVEFFYVEELYIRQSGNKVFGVPKDSINEYLIMDFDASVGDTISNVFTMEPEPWFYRGIVLSKDSILLVDGSYFSSIEIGVDSAKSVIGNEGFFTATPQYSVFWQEKGLCYSNDNDESSGGGYVFNMANAHVVMDLVWYLNPTFCTTDTIAPLGFHDYGNSCDYCNPIATEILELPSFSFTISPNPTSGDITFQFETYQSNREILITDLLGKQIARINANNEKVAYNFQEQQNGIYIVQLFIDGKSIESKKVVLSK